MKTGSEIRAATVPGDGGLKLSAIRRLALTGWAAGIVVACALMVFAPPTAQIGNRGWLAAAGIQILSTAGLVFFRVNHRRLGLRALLVITWTLPIDIAAMQWLAGGWKAPYHELLLPALILGAAWLPARRLVPFAGAVAVLAMLPALYAPSGAQLVGMLTELVVWVLVVGSLSFLTARVRGHARLARVDQLTRLANRRALDELFEKPRPGIVTLGVGDLNGFKAVNDRFGHVEGDASLSAVARCLAQHARESDQVFRWGGDEFAVLMPNTTYEQAAAVFARLENAISAEVADPAGNPIAITFGWAEGDAGTDLRSLTDEADRELLARKPYSNRPTGIGDRQDAVPPMAIPGRPG